jgi:dGTPase
MVVAVFEALASDPTSLLPVPTLERHEASDDPLRVICDHIAGMTDAFLLKTYDRLFSPRMGSVFDRI